MKPSTHIIAISSIVASILFCCCHPSGMRGVLEELDALSEKYPRYVHHRAMQLYSENDASPYQKAYIGLLISISSFHTGKPIQSDSLINTVVEELEKKPDFLPRNYLRALIYQGIIRYQLGSIDSRAYLPIKQALDIDAEKNVLDIRSKLWANYHLGRIHNTNNNIGTAHRYYQIALVSAEKTRNDAILFTIHRDLYWNRMKARDLTTARSLLESLQNTPITSEEQARDVKNAESAYFNSRGNYHHALKIDYELMAADKRKSDSTALLADYFRISDNYRQLHILDSALHYGELATMNIIDTTYYLNYHYYLNVAEIADMMHNTEKSATAYRSVYRLQNNAITQQLNTQILELERKFNVASAENRAIRLENNNLWLRLLLVIVLLLLIIGYLLYRNKTKMQREREKAIQREKRIAEQEKELALERERKTRLDKHLAERELVEKQFVIPIYRQISQRNLNIKNLLLDLQSNPHMAKHPPLLEKIAKEYNNFIAATKITESQLINDELFAQLTGISPDANRLFTESEKMMLAFIAIHADNQQMATLLNTSVESVRVRKSKLKKKMVELNLKVEEAMWREVD